MVKTKYHKMVRKIKAKPPVPPKPLIDCLPASPLEFERAHPSLVAQWKIEDCWVEPRVSVSQIDMVDVAMNCRGGQGGACDTLALSSNSDSMAQFIDRARSELVESGE